VHPRLTVNPSVFRRGSRLEEDIAVLRAAGAERIGLGAPKLLAAGEEGVLAVVESGPQVTHLVQPGLVGLGAADPHRGLLATIDAATRVGASIVYGPTGGAPALEWEEAADAFVEAIAPARSYAEDKAVRLLVEPTISLIADLSILFTLADTVELAARTGLGVCIDVQHCWHERGLRPAIAAAAGTIGLVQLSDWLPGNRAHVRAVPGDGAIPLDRIVGWILETGYTGLFDLELYPEPDIREQDTIARGLERATALLDRLGA